MTDTPREAIAISGIPTEGNGKDDFYYIVGMLYSRPQHGGGYKIAGTVSRITVTCDLPGLHCHMERVRVFDGETLIFEAPLHNLESVTYAAPERKTEK